MADIEDSEARQRGRGERRPDSVANFKARELRGRLQGPPTARVADFKARQLRGRRATRSGGGRA